MSEKSAAELISRNLEASNRGLQDRVAKLSHDFHQLQQMVRPAYRWLIRRCDRFPLFSSFNFLIGEPLQKSVTALAPMVADSPPSPLSDGDTCAKMSTETQCELSSDLEDEKRRLEAEKQTMKVQLEAAQRLTEQYSQELGSIQAQMAIAGEQLQKAKLDSSRACVQNRDLKSQLEELQDVFVRLVRL